MSKWDADVMGCTGLLAGNNFLWQAGLRFVVAQTAQIWETPGTIVTPMNGYAGWENFAASVIRRRPPRVILPVHSNGGKFATFAAHRCWRANCPTEFVIVMFDRTLGRCAALEGNVIAALDMHVNKDWLDRGASFNGKYAPMNFNGETSHIGVTKYAPAQQAAFNFARKWKI